MKIKELLAIMIENAKQRSFSDQLREMELSKSYSKGKLAYYKMITDDLMIDMTNKKGIADNWVLDGRYNDFEDWIELYIEANPGPEIWNEVQIFLKQYFRLQEYENIIKENEPAIKEKGEMNIDQKALIAFYESNFITEDKGRKLARRYRFYKKNMDRRTSPPKEINSDLKAINYFEKRKEVISCLSTESQKKAQDELDMLRRNLKAEYPNCIFK